MNICNIIQDGKFGPSKLDIHPYATWKFSNGATVFTKPNKTGHCCSCFFYQFIYANCKQTTYMISDKTYARIGKLLKIKHKSSHRYIILLRVENLRVSHIFHIYKNTCNAHTWLTVLCVSWNLRRTIQVCLLNMLCNCCFWEHLVC